MKALKTCQYVVAGLVILAVILLLYISFRRPTIINNCEKRYDPNPSDVVRTQSVTEKMKSLRCPYARKQRISKSSKNAPMQIAVPDEELEKILEPVKPADQNPEFANCVECKPCKPCVCVPAESP